MTSKNLFFKLIKEDLKRRIWTIPLSVLVFFLAYPVLCAMYLDNYKTTSATDVMIQGELLTIFGPDNVSAMIIAAIAAVICGLSSFFYLHSRKKVDLYHSIPVKRESLFIANYANGVFIYIIPYMISLVACFLILSANGQMTLRLFKISLATFSIHLSFYLLLYTLVVITVMLTGNFVVNLLGAFVFYFYGMTLVQLKDIYYSEFFMNYYHRASELGFFAYLSPLNIYYNTLDKYNGSYESVMYTLLKVILLTLCFISFALFLYKKRPSEAAQKAMAFQISKPIIKFLLVIPISLIGAIIFRDISSSEAIAWYFFGLIFFLLLSYAIIEIIYHFDIKKAFHGRLHLLISSITVVLIAITFQYDLIGFDSYVPKKKDIASMSINIEGLSNQTTYIQEVNPFNNLTITKPKLLLDSMDLNDFDAAYALGKKGSAIALTDERDYISYDIKYTLKNGRKIYRTYKNVKEDSYDLIKTLYDKDDFKKAMFPLLQWESSKLSKVTLMNEFETKTITLDESKKSRFLELYQKELRNLSLDELSSEESLATISLEYSGYRRNEYYIYPSFHNTIEFLKELGFDSERRLTSEDIKSILVYNYSNDYDTAYPTTEVIAKNAIYQEEISYSKDMDVKPIEYTAKEEFDAILLSIISSESFNNNRSVIDCDRRFDVVITYYMDEYKNTNTISYYFKANQVPEFVLTDFKAMGK